MKKNYSEKEPIRRLLFSALFDIDTNKNAFDSPLVSVFFYTKTETIETWIRHEFNFLPLKNIPLSMMKNLNSKEKLYNYCKDALNRKIPLYQGKKIITDFYMSSAYSAIMMSEFNIINVDVDPEPDQY